MQSSTFVRRLALATGSILAHPEQGADFNSASCNFKALGAFFCNFAAVRLVASRQPEARTASRAPCTRFSGFEASETIPIPGADSIFSSRCGAISGRLRCGGGVSRSYPGIGLSRSLERREEAVELSSCPRSEGSDRKSSIRRREMAVRHRSGSVRGNHRRASRPASLEPGPASDGERRRVHNTLV